MEGRARIRHLRVQRDLFYLELQGGKHGTSSPVYCLPGEYFLLGDNSGDSEDSRHYGPVPESLLVGRPLMVLLPLNRMRWL